MFDACVLCQRIQFVGFFYCGGTGFFHVDVFPGVNGPAHVFRPEVRCQGIKVNLIVGIRQHFLRIGGPVIDAGLLRAVPEFDGIPSYQHRIRHNGFFVRDPDTALLYDRHDGPHQVLIRPHPTRHPVHDHPDFVNLYLFNHTMLLREFATDSHRYSQIYPS